MKNYADGLKIPHNENRPALDPHPDRHGPGLAGVPAGPDDSGVGQVGGGPGEDKPENFG